jgi:hypothetical protein
MIDYEQDTLIDPDALDVEWLKQAQLMGKYVAYSASAKKDMDDSKEKLDMGKAYIEMDIRKNPAKYELEKITEGAIQSTILLQEEYQKLNAEYNETKYEYEISVAAVRAIDQKKTALENLVKLLGVSYFAGPKAPRDLSREWIQESERKAKNAKVRLKRKVTAADD